MEAHAKEVETLELDADWLAFVKTMEADEPDGTPEIESRIDYYLEKIRDDEVELRRNTDVANRRLYMIEDWLAGENAKIRRRITYLTGQIGMLAPSSVAEMEAEHGKKSRTLPNGSFGYRSRPDSIDIEDATSALNYAKDEGLEVTVKESVSKTVLNTHAKETGVAEGRGWHLETGGPEFFVKPAK